jgi:hypothetical protein
MKTIRSQILITAFIGCLAFSQITRAVIPPPDGGYPGFNTAEGSNALKNLTTGIANAAIGWYSLFSDTDGSFNTAIGAGTLVFNIGDQNTGEGTENTAVGTAALLSNTTGFGNTAVGSGALASNATGGQNTANGNGALINNQTGAENTAVGYQALYSNTGGPGDNGSYNKAFGNYALWSNTDGWGNNAFGWSALTSNTSGIVNNAFGDFALFSNTTGTRNTVVGDGALTHNTTGNRNNGFGVSALHNNVTGEGNTAIGHSAGHNIEGDFNICIGAFVEGNSGESNTIRIGDNLPNDPGASACFIGGINGQTATDGTAVFIDATGKLATLTSSARFKEQIKPMDRASEALFLLKPVSFRYKKEIDPRGTAQLGVVAEDVEKVNPDLVVRDKEGKPYSVRYDQVNAMLLNEFLKEHRTVTELKEQIAALTATVKEQATQIEKVSAHIGMKKSAQQIVLNDR